MPPQIEPTSTSHRFPDLSPDVRRREEPMKKVYTNDAAKVGI